jgi:hypothetical protein
VMKTIICSETLPLLSGPQLEEARFPGQSVGTDRERCSKGPEGTVRGRDRDDPGSFRCGWRAGASLSVLGGAMNSMGKTLEKPGPERLFTRVRGRDILRSWTSALGRSKEFATR